MTSPIALRKRKGVATSLLCSSYRRSISKALEYVPDRSVIISLACREIGYNRVKFDRNSKPSNGSMKSCLPSWIYESAFRDKLSRFVPCLSHGVKICRITCLPRLGRYVAWFWVVSVFGRLREIVTHHHQPIYQARKQRSIIPRYWQWTSRSPFRSIWSKVQMPLYRYCCWDGLVWSVYAWQFHQASILYIQSRCS